MEEDGWGSIRVELADSGDKLRMAQDTPPRNPKTLE